MEFIVAALHDCNKLPPNILFVIFQKYVYTIYSLLVNDTVEVILVTLVT